MRHYLTFGVGQPYAGCYVEFDESVTYEEAREWIVEAHGAKWSSLYTTLDFGNQDKKHNLHKLGTFGKDGTNNVRLRRENAQ